MQIQKFEDLISWQKSKELAIFVYKLFNVSRDFGFKDQIQRAVISISNNIAEGFERGGDKELRYFLYISKGSCGEVRSMAHVALELNYIKKEEFNHISNATDEISRLLAGFIKKL